VVQLLVGGGGRDLPRVAWDPQVVDGVSRADFAVSAIHFFDRGCIRSKPGFWFCLQVV